MNYEEDELERMKARREQRRSRNGRSAGTSHGNSKRSTGTADTFKSGYSGPRSGSGSGRKEQRSAHGKRRGSNKKKRIVILVAEVIILLMLIVGAAGWYVYERTFGALQKIEFDEEEVTNLNLTDDQLASMKGYLNIACFGVDSRSSGGKMNVGRGTNADVNLICSVNMETGEIRLVSVFRDSYLNINDKNSYNKVNAAYAQGGPEQAVKALNKNLGLNITQYATFNWKAVADAINILGGVDIDISENEFSWINAFITETVKETGIPSTQLTHSGKVHLDGVQAVAYGRLRYGDTDYARTERQRIILQKAFEKAKKASWADLNNIIETVMPQLATNLGPTDLIPMARTITRYHIGETSGFPSARGEMDIGKIGDCVIPQTLEANVKELHRFLFDEEDYQIPSNVREYSKHICEVTGMYKEGKFIGHVPVDQGVNAKSYINRKAKKQEQKAKQEADMTEAQTSTKESESGTLTEEESTVDSSQSSTEESTGFWDDDDWDDDDWDDDWNSGPGTEGPGSGPGGQVKPSQPVVKPGETKPETNPDASGPGKNQTPGKNEKPGAEVVVPSGPLL